MSSASHVEFCHLNTFIVPITFLINNWIVCPWWRFEQDCFPRTLTPATTDAGTFLRQHSLGPAWHNNRSSLKHSLCIVKRCPINVYDGLSLIRVRGVFYQALHAAPMNWYSQSIQSAGVCSAYTSASSVYDNRWRMLKSCDSLRTAEDKELKCTFDAEPLRSASVHARSGVFSSKPSAQRRFPYSIDVRTNAEDNAS